MTNLYKSAAASQNKARAVGYQDALDDLLAFLDKENLGLMDGEGWRVRQWATERLVDDGAPKPAAGNESDEETVQEERRSTSPAVKRKQPPVAPSSSDLTDDNSPRRSAVSEPPQTQPALQPPTQAYTFTVPSIDDFAFRSTHTAYPTNHDRDATHASMEVDNTNTTPQTPSSTDTVRIITRPHRGRHSNHNRQRGNGPSAVNINLGSGAGGKRKLPYHDFFDISGFNGFDSRDGKDGGGSSRGGKRGRHV